MLQFVAFRRDARGCLLHIITRNLAPADVAADPLWVDDGILPSVEVAPPSAPVPVCDETVSLLLNPVGCMRVSRSALLGWNETFGPAMMGPTTNAMKTKNMTKYKILYRMTRLFRSFVCLIE
jgi:hypothetical protein